MARLDDGHGTLFQIGDSPLASLWEKTVTPPGIDGGDPVDTTTMHNKNMRTFEPRKLKTLTEAGASCAYDTSCYSVLNGLINKKKHISTIFPDGSRYTFWGYLRVFTPDEISEGEQPTAQVSIQPCNTDESGEESEPEYSGPVAGFNPQLYSLESRIKANKELREEMAEAERTKPRLSPNPETVKVGPEKPEKK